MVKILPASAGDARAVDLIPGLGRSPGVGNGTLLQEFCLENSTGRGAWGASPRGHKESDMTEQLSTWWIYSTGLVSGVQHRDTVFLQIIYYRLL